MTYQPKKKEPGVIQRLEESVVNRIAAGEVIQRPANALKELMENSLDAGATSIQISVKSGGLKTLQIQDNGCGIRKEDFPIVCERFTTSKLKKFEDLEQIETYGFRGEALASISFVAHVIIVSKTEGTVCAYRGEYSEGKLKENIGNNPKSCAGNQGTIITVEDLFYNMETRRRALKNPSEEHSKIVDVVTRYAVHNSRVGFIVKKMDGNVDIRTQAGTNIVDNIRILYGGQIARELLEIKSKDNPHYKMNGYISNVNFNTKKATFILFINHRLVDSTAIRKAVDSVYATHLPKGSHPFIYLSIEISPRNVDVNVHPTKHEVHFLHEDVVVGSIAAKVDELLVGSSQSRTFYVQSLLPGATAIETHTGASVAKRQQKTKGSSSSSNVIASGKSKAADTKEYQKDMVRTESGMQKLDKFLTSTPVSNGTNVVTNFGSNSSVSTVSGISNISGENRSRNVEIVSPAASISSNTGRRREIGLSSLKKLRMQISSDCHSSLLSLIRNHTFVGCVDRTRVLIQHETKLYMVNTCNLSFELFYQKIMSEFGNFGRIVFDDVITIKDVVLSALDLRQEDGGVASADNYATAENMQNLLVKKAKMLDDYFALKLDSDGHIRTLPMLIENYYPSVDFIGNFFIDLAEKVDWTKEKECFESFANVMASFYAIKPGDDESCEETSLNGRTWKWTIEHFLYPELKSSLLPPRKFAEDSTVVQLADLPDLYKVFERC